MKPHLKPHLTGETVIADITELQPNSWNGNTVDERTMASIRYGFSEDGWLVSNALTVWRTDETGTVRNIIIDGEHRWLCALDVGLTEGPVMFLDGITEKQARALTLKLYRRRGDWDPEEVSRVLAELGAQAEADTALLYAMADEELQSLIASSEELSDLGEVSLEDIDMSAPPDAPERKRKVTINVTYWSTDEDQIMGELESMKERYRGFNIFK